MTQILNETGEVMTVLLIGEIDHHNAPSIRNKIDLEITKTFPQKLELDFGAVTFMDSSGIGLVMGRYKLMNEYGGKIIIKNVPKQFMKVMKISGLDKIATINMEGVKNESC